MASHGILSYLPPGDGWLPPWLLLFSVVSIGNSIGCYTSLTGPKKVYTGVPDSTPTRQTTSKPPAGTPARTLNSSATTSPTSTPVNHLSARTFGTWTALSSIIRLYAAYNISNPPVYQLALWSYVIAFAHFGSEWLVYGTARWGQGLAGPVFVSTISTVWMLTQWGYYVQ